MTTAAEAERPARRARGARDRAAARGDPPALRLRLPRVRAGLAEAAALAADPGRAARRRSRASRSACCTTRPCMERLLLDLSINVTSMFRDPTFYAAFREQVVPILRTYPFVAHLGRRLLDRRGGRTRWRSCSTRRALARPRADLRDRHQRGRARAARGGRLPARQDAGVHAELHPRGRQARVLRVLHRGLRRRAVRPLARRNVVFAQHNLVSDRSFNEFHVIVCRNVMIYFDRSLQDQRARLFYESLAMFGVLALGPQGVDPVHARTRTLRGARPGRAALPEGELMAVRASSCVGCVVGRVARGRASCSTALPERLELAVRGRAAPRHRRAAAGSRRCSSAHTRCRCVEADDKDPIEPRPRLPRAARLPPARRARLLRALDRRARHFARPSIDVLFESAADAYGERRSGSCSPGANEDGARRARAVKARGGVASCRTRRRRRRRDARRRRSRPPRPTRPAAREIGQLPARARACRCQRGDA